MPRWPEGYVAWRRKVCPACGGKKDFNAATCSGCNIPKTPLAGVKGPLHPAWKSGARIDKDGYIKTYAPDHPWPRKGGYVFEHVRLIELQVGRRVLPGESVHHVDGDRRNNSINNLQLMERGDHSRLHRLVDSRDRLRDSSWRFAPGRRSPSAGE